MDVFGPKANANGLGIVLFVSEGWYSEHEKIEPNIPIYIEAFLTRGYTVFAVVHGSNPKYSLPENIEDAHRAVRFIRHHARRYGIDPTRIGSTGDSAGGHLSLMVGGAGRAPTRRHRRQLMRSRAGCRPLWRFIRRPTF
jgi:acetyl esterase/lipase